MAAMNVYHLWLMNALFWIGVLISLLGAFLIVSPGSAMSLNTRLNRWVSTEKFFNQLDKPRYHDAFFYRRHGVFGFILLISCIYILYMLLFRTDITEVALGMPIVSNVQANEWLYESLVIFLVSTNFIIMLVSIVLIVRPSGLKKIEAFLNKWVKSEQTVERLDHQIDIPETILPGNVRVFGSVVFLGGLYIAVMTGGSLIL